MKKLLCMLLTLMLVFSFTACGGGSSTTPENTGSDQPSEQETAEPEVKVPETAEDILKALQEKNDNLTDIVVFDEETDPNGKLGRPGNYIGKADFADARVEEYWTTEEEKLENGLNGGTIEVFSSKKDCDARYENLKQYMGAVLGAFGLNQYMYKYDLVIFRVSYNVVPSGDVVPSGAEEYKTQLDEILNEVGEVAE